VIYKINPQGPYNGAERAKLKIAVAAADEQRIDEGE
jgi:hypothetical protein